MLLNRRLSRRIRYHLALAAISALLILLIARNFTAGPLERVSGASAYAGLLMLAATLLLGPLNVLRLRANPVSSDLRRDCGIWTALLGITHTTLALWVPLRGAFWRVFALTPRQVRLDSLGFANDVGLLATILLLILLTLSNDYALRRLGRARWKAAQRLSYVLFAFVALHTLLYQRLVQPGPLFQALLGLVVVGVLALQAAGWFVRQSQHSR